MKVKTAPGCFRVNFIKICNNVEIETLCIILGKTRTSSVRTTTVDTDATSFTTTTTTTTNVS